MPDQTLSTHKEIKISDSNLSPTPGKAKFEPKPRTVSCIESNTDSLPLTTSIDAKFALFEAKFREMQEKAKQIFQTDSEIKMELGEEMEKKLLGNGSTSTSSSTKTKKTTSTKKTKKKKLQTDSDSEIKMELGEEMEKKLLGSSTSNTTKSTGQKKAVKKKKKPKSNQSEQRLSSKSSSQTQSLSTICEEEEHNSCENSESEDGNLNACHDNGQDGSDSDSSNSESDSDSSTSSESESLTEEDRQLLEGFSEIQVIRENSDDVENSNGTETLAENKSTIKVTLKPAPAEKVDGDSVVMLPGIGRARDGDENNSGDHTTSVDDKMQCVLPWSAEVDWGSSSEEETSESETETESDDEIDCESRSTNKLKKESESEKKIKIYRRAAKKVYKQGKKWGIKVAKSQIGDNAGYGLFADRAFKRYETVMYYEGQIICKPLTQLAGSSKGMKKSEGGSGTQTGGANTKLLEKLETARGAAEFKPKRKKHDKSLSESESTDELKSESDSKTKLKSTKPLKSRNLKSRFTPLHQVIRTSRAYRFMMELDFFHDLDGSTGGERPYAGCLAAYSNSCLGLERAEEVENMFPISDFKSGLGPRCVRFMASRDIEVGEELLWEYRFATSGDRDYEDLLKIESEEGGYDPVYLEYRKLVELEGGEVPEEKTDSQSSSTGVETESDTTSCACFEYDANMPPEPEISLQVLAEIDLDELD